MNADRGTAAAPLAEALKEAERDAAWTQHAADTADAEVREHFLDAAADARARLVQLRAWLADLGAGRP